MPDPVSIRTKNPGAMWPGSVSRKFGSTEHEDLRDGNKAAIFPTFTQGAAAQFYLWAHSYSGLTLQSAIYKWSGHNSSSAYADFLSKHIPGLSMGDVITNEFLAGPKGLAFMKAQSQWEAGRPYPMSDDQWARAQVLAFGTGQEATPQPVADNLDEPDEGVTLSADAVKPLTQSKTMWGGIGAWLTSLIGMVSGFFDKLNNPYTFSAFIILIIVVSVCVYLVIKGRIDINNTVKSLVKVS